ncbi:hypothetical protein DM02DRAFT_668147 [Periconia macrospinosa]|uniref:Uncharacterized protein n=1 Tax=Periconia macrospinosa TaxID=97972 RepID=A0A2V1E652_9PLEO|nr:hypothetical protein DM02DRAFT_668147 [Periconia macrospinosa]
MLAEGAAAYIQQLAISDLEASRLDDRDALLILAKEIQDLESARIDRIEEIRSPLLSMLRRFRAKKSSDPRDKVFALLGLSREHIQALIKPDYSLSEDEVMLQTTIAVISESRSLEPLAGRVSGPEHLPSWATNWHKSPAGNERERLECLRSYDACGGQPGIAHLHAQSLLEVQGYCIGQVEQLGDEAPDGGFDRLRGFVLRWADTLIQIWNWRYPDGKSAFWRTITADTLYVESLQGSSWPGQDAKYRRATNNGSAAFEAWKADNSSQRNRKTAFGPEGVRKSYVQPEDITRLKNSFHYAV